MTFQTPIEALAVLGLDQTATRNDIKSAYHRMAAYYHPDAYTGDAAGATEAFLAIQSAYEYLIDAYDKAVAAYESQSVATVSGSPRVIGNKADITRQKTNRHFAREHLKQEKRLQKEHQQKLRRLDEERAARAKQKAEEEELKAHARRAAEITAELIQSMLLYGGVEALDKPFE